MCRQAAWVDFVRRREAGAPCAFETHGCQKLKVGHAGTLDPLATGVMILATGRCTKRIEELQSHTKEYVATLRLGATTPSFDLETEIDCERPWEHISLADVEAVLPMFVGRISQVPPAYSACKVDGKRAYKMARKGKEVSIRPKELLIESIELLPSELPEVAIRVVCGKGTYIRALARDIGERLGCGAHLTALRRTKVGDIALGNAKRQSVCSNVCARKNSR